MEISKDFEDLHSLMVVFPGVTEDLSLFIELSGEVLAKLTESVLEFLLESVKCVMDISHSLNCLLFVLLDLSACEMERFKRLG